MCRRARLFHANNAYFLYDFGVFVCTRANIPAPRIFCILFIFRFVGLLSLASPLLASLPSGITPPLFSFSVLSQPGNMKNMKNTLFDIKTRTNIKKKLPFSAVLRNSCVREACRCAHSFWTCHANMRAFPKKAAIGSHRDSCGWPLALAFGAGLWRWPLALPFAPRSATTTGDASPGWACKAAS